MELVSSLASMKDFATLHSTLSYRKNMRYIHRGSNNISVKKVLAVSLSNFIITPATSLRTG